MIVIGLIASALVAAMFWSPNFERGRELRDIIPEEVVDPVADTWLEDKTIRIYLGELDHEQLEQLGCLYHGTPIYPLIRGYLEVVQSELEAEAEKARRTSYIGLLNSRGYGNELLAPLDTGTLERILKDLE